MKIFKIVVVTLIVLTAGGYLFVKMHSVDDIPVEQLTSKWMYKTSSFVDVNGLRVHVSDEGANNSAVPIVLIHGTGASLHTWDGWVSELKNERRVIRFDLPGFGLTGPEPDNNYTIEQYTNYVVRILDSLGVSEAIIAGNSLGGYIAWATAVRYPNRVSKLVLVDASGYPYEAESVPIAFKLSQNKLAKLLLKNFIPKFVIRSSVENVFGNPALVTDYLVDRYYELTLREGNRAAIKERFVQTQPGELRKSLPKLTIPTLILWGAKDKLIPLKLGKRFEKDIPNSSLIIFDELGHVPHEEAPQITVSPVLDFINE
ncbi:MAG: alpha/beta hydrolase [Pseudomonadota bacterium]|nr:alpha/beta hydrolase [Pseudomonadota bacterium]